MDQDQAVRVAFFSEHASPLALRGGEDAGGQNVYVDEVSRNLVAHGYRVDIFTRRSSDDVPFIIDWATGVRVINLTAGPVEFLLKDALWPSMPAFCAAFLQFVDRSGEHYDLIHSNFWMSGWAACEVRRQLNLPVVHIFHAMGKTKRRHQGDDDTSPDERIQIEMQVIREVDRLIAQCPSEERELLDDYAADPRKVVVIPWRLTVMFSIRWHGPKRVAWWGWLRMILWWSMSDACCHAKMCVTLCVVWLSL